MTHLLLGTFYEAYDAHDITAMKTWSHQCLKVNPQMLVEVFCACAQDPDESVAVDFMLTQLSNTQQWDLAAHLFKEKKGAYFYSLLPKLSAEHSYTSFGYVDDILMEAVHTQDMCLLQSIIPHIANTYQYKWDNACAPLEVDNVWVRAMDKAVDQGSFEIIKALLPHTSEQSRVTPILRAVELQRKDYVEHIFEQSSFDFSVKVALSCICMDGCRKMSRHILNTYPDIVSSDFFLSCVQEWDNEEDRQWVEKYMAQKQRSKISSSVRSVTQTATAVSRKM